MDKAVNNTVITVDNVAIPVDNPVDTTQGGTPPTLSDDHGEWPVVGNISGVTAYLPYRPVRKSPHRLDERYSVLYLQYSPLENADTLSFGPTDRPVPVTIVTSPHRKGCP